MRPEGRSDQRPHGAGRGQGTKSNFEVGDDGRARGADYRGNVCAGVLGAGHLGEPQLVLVYGVCRRESAAVGVHELVPGGNHFEETRGRRRTACANTMARLRWCYPLGRTAAARMSRERS